MVGEEERKEERKEGSKEREERKRKERERGRKGGKIDCRSLHIKLFMNFHYLQMNSGALVWLQDCSCFLISCHHFYQSLISYNTKLSLGS